MYRPGHDEWVKLIAEYEVSGLSQKEFVAKHDVSFSTFQYWLYRRNKKVRTVSNSPPEFLPVEVVNSPAPKARRGEAKAAVEIELPSGVQVRLSSGTSASFVGELLAAIK